MRYKQARDIAMNLAELTMREIATQIHQPEEREISLTIFNLYAKKRNEVIEAEVYLPQETFSILDANGAPLEYTILA